MNRSFTTIIMAAGKGKRMKSDLPKVLHQLAGRPLVHHVIDLAGSVGSDRIILVVSHKKELVIESTKAKGVEWAIQKQPSGTGDAVDSCRSALHGYTGDVLILSGDVPMLRKETILKAYVLHQSTDAVATGFTFKPDNPKGYGRIIRGTLGDLLGIVEQEDASTEQRKIGEVNAGIYFFKAEALFTALDQVTNDNVAKEYYLTDTIAILAGQGQRMSAYLVDDPVEMAGVNDPDQLAELERQYLAGR
ncbi:MAG: NTP transferase domain-containing protein [Candidatus Electryoneaceae bacterium]|nr:NTP transferase domain-containing protein [Candidatus Electryoneaceae bacterium]